MSGFTLFVWIIIQLCIALALAAITQLIVEGFAGHPVGTLGLYFVTWVFSVIVFRVVISK